MTRTPLGADTPAEVERMQVEAWRRMVPAEKLAIVSALTQACVTLAAAGIRQRHPHASEREQFLRLAVLMLGAELAAREFPEVALLTER